RLLLKPDVEIISGLHHLLARLRIANLVAVDRWHRGQARQKGTQRNGDKQDNGPCPRGGYRVEVSRDRNGVTPHLQHNAISLKADCIRFVAAGAPRTVGWTHCSRRPNPAQNVVFACPALAATGAEAVLAARDAALSLSASALCRFRDGPDQSP